MFKFFLSIARRGISWLTAGAVTATPAVASGSIATAIGALVTMRAVLAVTGITFIVGVILALPDATPIPPVVKGFIFFVVDGLYIFDALFPVDVFLSVIGLMVRVAVATLVAIFGMWIFNTVVLLMK